ncbi:hypothetical protein D3C79_1028000 [compost metagenome]
MGLAARCAYFVQQRLQLVSLSAGDAGDVALLGEPFGNLAPGGIPRADHKHYFLLSSHVRLFGE